LISGHVNLKINLIHSIFHALIGSIIYRVTQKKKGTFEKPNKNLRNPTKKI